MTNGFEYVTDLSLNEKLVFLRMIIRLIGKDSRIDDSERTFMKELAKQYQIPREYSAQINQSVSEEDLISEAKNLLGRKKSLYLIKELLTVANSDDDLDDNEIDFVIRVSKALGIEDEKVAEINQLVLDQMSWLDRYHQALEM
ncbi:MAG: TerB family tellurite resistance protein [Alphaproteobacteria bacterium]|nr:TerB family tellurite resistance protein [Alphaproteobacteria bacterium]